MILLQKSLLDNSLYQFSASDIPSVGSETDIYTNIIEMANVLDPFDVVLSRVLRKIKSYNLPIDEQIAKELLFNYYEGIRHGMAFDWVMNYVVKLILDYLPSGHQYFIFKGTMPFVETFKDDEVFQNEIKRLSDDLVSILNWVFKDKSHDYLKNLHIMDTISEEDKELIDRSSYLILLIEMLVDSIGYVKQQHWTEQFYKMVYNHPYVVDHVIVVGCANRAFAFGNLDNTTVKWHLLSKGIQMSGSYRTQRKEYIRAFPDEQTFVRLDSDVFWIDETYFPTISIDNGDFLNAVDYTANGIKCDLDVPHQLTLKYKFKQDINNPKQIKLRAGENCIIRDSLVTLDSDGKAETQIVFRGSSATFKVADPDKKYPFGIFTTKKITGNTESFAWL